MTRERFRMLALISVALVVFIVLLLGRQGEGGGTVAAVALETLDDRAVIWQITQPYDDEIDTLSTARLLRAPQGFALFDRTQPDTLRFYALDGEFIESRTLALNVDGVPFTVQSMAIDERGRVWASVSGANVTAVRFDAAGQVDLRVGPASEAGVPRRASAIMLGPDRVAVLDADPPRRIVVWDREGNRVDDWRFDHGTGITEANGTLAGGIALYERQRRVVDLGVDHYSFAGDVLRENLGRGLDVPQISGITTVRADIAPSGDLVFASLNELFYYDAGAQIVRRFGEAQTARGPLTPGTLARLRDFLLLDDGSVILLDENGAHWQLARVMLGSSASE